MSVILFTIKILAAAICSITAIISIPLFFRFRWPAAGMWGLKLFVSALSPVFVLVGVFTTIAGIATGSSFTVLISILVVLVYSFHITSITRPPDESTGFEKAFGKGWQKNILPGQSAQFLAGRRILRMGSPRGVEMEKDICFATIPGSNRKLLCDIWMPPKNVPHSGLAFIYLHGSAFYLLDKDYGTRPFFKQLASQGHVIMDVAYRLAAETDIMGMVHDVKRAIVWMKEQSRTFGINPDRVMAGGGSAGGHLALLAAYTTGNRQFIPAELEGKDDSVCGVISLYGTNDLTALYYHTNQHLTTRSIPGNPKKPAPAKMSEWVMKAIGKDYHRLGFDQDFAKVGTLAPLLGGHPDECPERYELLSPNSHIHKNCPPTLLIHGEHDIMAPVSTTRYLYSRLAEEKVPVILHILPQTDHAFDLAFPNIAPAAHNAIYDVERFMAVMAGKKRKDENMNAITTSGLTSEALADFSSHHLSNN